MLLGAAVFLLYDRVVEPRSSARGEIVVEASRIAQLAEAFARTWQRPPTEAELTGLIDDFVVEEILYREALALGLERDDLIVRRRMRQKMEFLWEGEVSLREPSRAELTRFLREHEEKFGSELRLSFDQVFLSRERRGAAAERDGERLLERLNRESPRDPSALGDPSLLPEAIEDRAPSEIHREFGGELAERLVAAPVGRWSGPFSSAYGLHVVRVREHTPARTPELGEVEEAVAREWRAAEQARAVAERLARLRERYGVIVETPIAPGETP